MSAAARSGWPPAVAHSPAQWPSLSSSFLREEGEGGCGGREGRQGRVGRGGVGGGGGAGQGEWEGRGAGSVPGSAGGEEAADDVHVAVFAREHQGGDALAILRTGWGDGTGSSAPRSGRWAGRHRPVRLAGSGRAWWPGSAPSRRSASTASTSPAEAARRRRREAMKTSLRPRMLPSSRDAGGKAARASRLHAAEDETREPRLPRFTR